VKVTFLAAAGWAGAQWTPLAGDASARRYDRVRGPGGRRAVLMDAPASRGEDVRPFWALTLWLRGEGLSAPAILAGDAAAGFLLLEDLGDALYGRVAAADPAAEFPIYAAAIDLLAALPRRPVPAALPWPGGLHPVPPYDRAALWREASLVTDWYLPGATGRPTPPDLALAYEAAIAEACAAVEGARACIALRDYHADNLLWLPERRGLARVGLLDYQDALRGHPAYDLVSLLEDARRDTTPELREAMIRRYLAASGAPEDAFRAAYAALGAQRNLKIIGIFARLWRRDGKPAYLDLIPRVWAHLMNDLAHPALAPLERLVRAHIPPPEPDVLARLRAAGSGTP
jgi:hypothetical protein